MTSSPPIPLRPAARKRWDQLIKLDWTSAQHADLAAYCAAHGRWYDAEEFLAAHEMIQTITDDKGNVKSHGPAPQIAISERAVKEMGRLALALNMKRKF